MWVKGSKLKARQQESSLAALLCYLLNKIDPTDTDHGQAKRFAILLQAQVCPAEREIRAQAQKTARVVVSSAR